MKTLTDLQSYYAQQIEPGLKVLEEQRKKVLKKIYLAAAIIIPITALPVILLFNISPYLSVFLLFLGSMIMGFIYFYSTKDYRSDFKTMVVKKIVEFVDDRLTYSKFGKVRQGLFSMSGLFLPHIDKYTGDDHVSGRIGKTAVEFSELLVSYYTRNSKGHRQEHTVFKGLFFLADFNKHFTGSTVVLPDTAERFLGHVGTFFQSMNKRRGDLIKLEDPEFEKLFAVYGNDQIEARYILSTSLMKRIVDFQKKTGKRIHLAFVGSKVFVAIPYAKDLFEPRVFKTVVDFAPVQEYFEDIQLAVSITDDLNLNTRVWSKQ